MSETETRKRLMSLMTRHQRQIFGYIYTLVPNRADAEDILQETSLVICEKFDTFKEGSDFVAWACQIAWWNVRRARQKFARSKVVFDDEVLEAVATTATTRWRNSMIGTKPLPIVWENSIRVIVISCSRATNPAVAWKWRLSAVVAPWMRLTRR